MAVLNIERYMQKDGTEILKVILKPTKLFPDGYFYCDTIDEELVRSCTWFLGSQRQPYVMANLGSSYNQQKKQFHREKAFNILDKYPDYINHIDGIEFDNVNRNLDKVTSQQNCWSKPSRGYGIDGRSFRGSVLIFVSMTFILIPEAGCGQSPQSLVNTGNSVNSLCWKS